MLVNESRKGAASKKKSTDALATEALIDESRKRAAERKGETEVKIDETTMSEVGKDTGDSDFTGDVRKWDAVVAAFSIVFCTLPMHSRLRDRLSRAQPKHGGEKEQPPAEKAEEG